MALCGLFKSSLRNSPGWSSSVDF